MIFLVSRASIEVPYEDKVYDNEETLENYHNTKPCEEAFKIEVTQNPYSNKEEDIYVVERWAIKINSLEELLKFREKYDTGEFDGEIDIFKHSGIREDYLMLVIHDEWLN